MADREYSAGGVVVREHEGRLEVAVIRPRGRSVTALPKGHIERGETSRQSAEREVLEETGLCVADAQKLGDVKYVYRFRGRTIFKVVSFYLFHCAGGVIDKLTDEMRKEVDVAHWIPLEEAVHELSFPGERSMAAKALSVLRPGTASPEPKGHQTGP